MNIEKLPLAERIRRYRSGRSAYPEYLPGVIRGLGQMPVMEYLSGIDPKQKQRFCELADIYDSCTTYQAAALRISELHSASASAAAEAMRILAEPMIRYDELLKREEVRAHDRYF